MTFFSKKSFFILIVAALSLTVLYGFIPSLFTEDSKKSYGFPLAFITKLDNGIYSRRSFPEDNTSNSLSFDFVSFIVNFILFFVLLGVTRFSIFKYTNKNKVKLEMSTNQPKSNSMNMMFPIFIIILLLVAFVSKTTNPIIATIFFLPLNFLGLINGKYTFTPTCSRNAETYEIIDCHFSFKLSDLWNEIIWESTAQFFLIMTPVFIFLIIYWTGLAILITKMFVRFRHVKT